MRTTKETVISLDDGDTLRIEGQGSFATVKIGGASFMITFDPDRSSKPIIDGLRTGDPILSPTGNEAGIYAKVDRYYAEQKDREIFAEHIDNVDIVYIDVTEDGPFTIFAL